MWKKLVSLNLALLMIFAMIPPASAAYFTDVYFYRNIDSNDTTQNKHSLAFSSPSDLMLYKGGTEYGGGTKFERTGHVITSWYANGKDYSLTDWASDVYKDAQEPPHVDLYAHWTPVTGNYIFYIGLGVGQATDGKDYVIQDGLSGDAVLKGEDAFQHFSESSKIIGWSSKEYGISGNKYYPEQKITINSNLTLFPITGYNYVTYQFLREAILENETEFYTSFSDAYEPVGLLDISDAAFSASHKADKAFCGWKAQGNGSGAWYTGLAKDAPHKLYAQTEAFPASGEYCILYSGLGVGKGDERICITLPLTDGKVTDLPEAPTDRYGYTFKGWYTERNGKGTKVENGSSLTNKEIIYAYWSKTGNPPEDKTYTITISGGGGTLPTDSSGKVIELPKDPTKDGYIFDGWYTGETGGNKVIIGTILNGNITIYPHWKPDSGNPSDKVYIIIIDGGGQVTTGSDGKLTTLPATPTRPGYIFDGWYTHPDGGDRVTTDYIFTGPITIYPHWREDSTTDPPDVIYYPIYTPDRTPGGSYSVSRRYATPGTRITIELSPRSSYDLDWLSVTNLTTGWDVPITERYWDEYTFIMPSSAVEVDISYVYRYNYNYHYSSNVYFTYAEPQPAAAGPNAWYYRDRHIYHVTDGLVPDITPITRDMLISVLYNLTDHSVTDSTAVGSETNDSQVWATEHNIVPDIYVSGLWGQDKTITREQAAMLIFRYAGYRGRSTSQSVGLTRYRDYSRLNPIARTAMSWTLATGLMSSTSAATLSPQDNLTCGQAGDLIYRFVTTIA